MKDEEEILIEEEATDVYEAYTMKQRWNGLSNIFRKSYEVCMKELSKNGANCFCVIFIIALCMPPLITGLVAIISSEDLQENGDKGMAAIMASFILWGVFYAVVVLVIVAICVIVKIVTEFIVFARNQYLEGLGEPEEI